MLQERVLIVDDQPAVRGIVAAMLDRGGYASVTATGANDALDQLQQDPDCGLVLSDVMMPGTDGLGLLDQIAQDHPEIPVVLFTAAHDIHIATNAFRRGATDYILKPFDPAQLLTVVARAVEHGRLRRQNAAYRMNLDGIVQARTAKLREAMRELEDSYDVTLGVMGDALDLRDEETHGHSRRVTAYTIALARELGLYGPQLAVIARGAFLHDIGKIATPDAVLLKPGKLDAHETAIMRDHCERGYELVRKIPFLREPSEIVYAHQEMFDGSGSPRGLRGEAIPLGARIFAVADTLDAMTSDRPYRRAFTFEQARVEIQRCSGTQFDPRIVQAFLGIPIARLQELRTEMAGASAALTTADLCRSPMAQLACA